MIKIYLFLYFTLFASCNASDDKIKKFKDNSVLKYKTIQSVDKYDLGEGISYTGFLYYNVEYVKHIKNNEKIIIKSKNCIIDKNTLSFFGEALITQTSNDKEDNVWKEPFFTIVIN